jgi:translation initiation factor 3 subunit G
MVFLASKEEAMRDAAEPPAALVPKIQCRYCKGDHWTTKCPLKEYYEKLESGKGSDSVDARRPQDSGSSTGAYRPPGMREGAGGSFGGKKYDSSRGGQQREEFTIRVTNLPEEATENDIMELFKPFGKVNRVFLATDKVTKQSRGFAFVNFQNKDDAQRAIYGVNDYGYHHLILKVEWAKPSKDS